MAVNDADQSHKPHRTHQSGASVKEKSKSDKKKKLEDGDNQQKQNPKAFAFSSSVKANRLKSRAVEKEQRRFHVPIVDRSYGKDRDVGQVLVRSLQNTKYPINEKLERSSINLFSHNPYSLVGTKGINEASEGVMVGEENNHVDMDGSPSSDQDEAVQLDDITSSESSNSDEDDDATDIDKHDEFVGGRGRTRPVFENDVDQNDLMDSPEEDEAVSDDAASSGSEFSDEEGDDNNTDEDDDMGNISRWKESLAERALTRQTPSLMQLVYGKITFNKTSANNEDSSVRKRKVKKTTSSSQKKK